MYWGTFSDSSALPNVGFDVGSNLTVGDTAWVGIVPYACVNAAAFPNAVWARADDFFQKFSVWTAQGNGTTVGLLGFGNTITGTATTRTVATGSLAASLRQLAYVSAAVAGSSAGTRHAALQFWRGDAAGRGGFLYTTKFVVDTVTAGMRWFVGLLGSAAVIGNVNPSTLTNIIGIAIDAGQTTVRVMNNDGAGAATVLDLGASFPAATAGAVYEVTLFAAPNSAEIYYRVRRIDVAAVAEGVLTADIPASTTLLSPQIWVNNGAAAAAVAISPVSQYIATEN